MKAVVMAGGAGSRLRPLTVNRPKPMVPIVNQPVIAHILDLVKRHGITEVVITLQFMAEAIQDYFGDGSSLGMHIDYSIEESPLGTAGSVKQAQHLLDDTFVVISGDALTDIDLSSVIEYHRQKKSLATLTLYRVPNPLEYGVVILNEDGRIKQFLEKPSWGEVISDNVNTGIYVLEPDVLDYFPAETKYDFSQELFPTLLEKGDPMYGYVAEGYWCDVGNLSEFMRANSDMLSGLVSCASWGEQLREGVWVGEGVEIAPDAQLYGPVFLGDGVKIKQGVIVHGPSVIRNYTVVDRYADIDRSIVWRNCYIGEGAELRGAIIGRQVSLKRKSVVFEGAVVGDSSVIGEGAIIHPNVKIWPNKEVEAGASVNSSIIWGAQGRHVLFGRFGVTGLVNIDLTPEFAARLGATFGASLPKGAVVTINRDPHRSPRMLKRGVISGLPSAGVNVLDLQSMPIPVARFYTRYAGTAGGVHLRLSPFDNRVVDIKFFDGNGQDLTKAQERSIEQVFFREDFRRVYLDEIGTISYADHVVERYQEAFMASLDVQAIREANHYVAVDFANAPTGAVLAPILTALNCRTVALNEAPDETKMSILPEEFQTSLEQLGKICQTLDTAMGVRLDVGGERVFVVHCGGSAVNGVRLGAMLADMVLRAKGGGTIAVPVSMPTVFERVAERYGGQVIRTKVNLHALMRAANEPGVVMATDGNGSFIWPEFQAVVDGMMTVAKLLEYMTLQNINLPQALANVPPYHMAQTEVTCPWESKGKVMRLLNQQYKERLGEQIDGVKIVLGDEEWVLVLPDADNPLFQVFAQAPTEEQASGLVQRYRRIVESFQD
ncbi:MAG: NTP transferase domain-containing protein [Chloroflexi bacterium]|nr:NTP transferase domain-containing protein [Chloroflexota bacterium]